MKIARITEESVVLEGGHTITFDHEQDCCEYNYANFEQIDDVAKRTEFIHPLKFEKIDGYGFRFGNEGNMFFVPCYSEQNGYYSSSIDIFYDGDKVLNGLICEELLED